MNNLIYLNENSYKKLKELHEIDLGVAAITGILAVLLGGLVKGIDYLFSGDKIKFKNKIKAVKKIFHRNELPQEFEYVLKTYDKKKDKYASIGLLGLWSPMSFSRELFNYPSLLMTLPLRNELDLSDSDIIVARPNGNKKSFLVLNSSNSIDLVTKVSRVNKYKSYKEMLEKYFKISDIKEI